jgi:hypothetical protein
MNDCYFEKKDWRECKQEVRDRNLHLEAHHVQPRQGKTERILEEKTS